MNFDPWLLGQIGGCFQDNFRATRAIQGYHNWIRINIYSLLFIFSITWVSPGSIKITGRLEWWLRFAATLPAKRRDKTPQPWVVIITRSECSSFTMAANFFGHLPQTSQLWTCSAFSGISPPTATRVPLTFWMECYKLTGSIELLVLNFFQTAKSTLWRNNSKLPRPYNWRLINFNLLTVLRFVHYWIDLVSLHKPGSLIAKKFR